MLAYPVSTTRKQKIEMIHIIKERLLTAHGDDIIAIGAYGSIALKTDGPFSDIELHVITKEVSKLASMEFIYDKFKVELSTKDRSTFIKQAKEVDDSWAIKAGVFIHILPIHDPTHLFDQVKDLPFEALDAKRRDIMKDFMVWEPYETIAKLRNNYSSGNSNYMDLGARDLLWQSAKLIGLANKTYYSTRAKTFEESMEMKTIPSGYSELLSFIIREQLQDKKEIYVLCENLWIGLNEWYSDMGLDYRVKELPI